MNFHVEVTALSGGDGEAGTSRTSGKQLSRRLGGAEIDLGRVREEFQLHPTPLWPREVP